MIEKKYLNRWVKDGYISMPIFSKKEVEEMSTTGGGASSNAGSGEGYMTPNAFKKKRKNN